MKTYYDVLNLDRNCSAKEIKDSFIRLSKKYHPDKNKSSDAHKKFTEINEAYSVLGKHTSRNKYDESLSYKKSHMVYNHRTTAYEQYAEMYSNNIRRQRDMRDAHIGIAKLKVVSFCIMLMLFGTGLHIISGIQKRKAMYHHYIMSKVHERNEWLRNQEKREMKEAKLKKELNSVNTGEQ